MTFKKRLRIISDGTAQGTRFLDNDTGQEITQPVMTFDVGYNWNARDPRGLLSAHVTLLAPSLDTVVEAEVEAVTAEILKLTHLLKLALTHLVELPFTAERREFIGVVKDHIATMDKRAGYRLETEHQL